MYKLILPVAVMIVALQTYAIERQPEPAPANSPKYSVRAVLRALQDTSNSPEEVIKVASSNGDNYVQSAFKFCHDMTADALRDIYDYDVKTAYRACAVVALDFVDKYPSRALYNPRRNVQPPAESVRYFAGMAQSICAHIVNPLKIGLCSYQALCIINEWRAAHEWRAAYIKYDIPSQKALDNLRMGIRTFSRNEIKEIYAKAREQKIRSQLSNATSSNSAK